MRGEEFIARSGSWAKLITLALEPAPLLLDRSSFCFSFSSLLALFSLVMLTLLLRFSCLVLLRFHRLDGPAPGASSSFSSFSLVSLPSLAFADLFLSALLSLVSQPSSSRSGRHVLVRLVSSLPSLSPFGLVGFAAPLLSSRFCSFVSSGLVSTSPGGSLSFFPSLSLLALATCLY